MYVLPNLLTTGNLFFGFFSIVKSLNGDFSWAASAIFLAAVFDILDGRVARLTHGTSEFGVQYDSLCDLVSFGLAPSFLMYQMGLSGLGRFGWIVCFVFLACGALRLARFNVQSSIGKASGDFTGLPIPMAALVVASFTAVVVNSPDEIQTWPSWLSQAMTWYLADPRVKTWSLAVGGIILGLAMVSNISYRSHKTVRITAIRPFRLLVMLVILLALVAMQPELCGFLLAFIYSLTGPIEWVLGWKAPTSEDEIFALGEGVEDQMTEKMDQMT